MKTQLHMKNTFTLLTLIAFLAACGNGASDAETKKKELETAQKEYEEMRAKITKLEQELKEIDPEYAKETNKSILVSTFVAAKKPFEHKIEARGSVASRRNVMVSAQVGGAIERVHVREGQRVSQGQVLVSLDADIIRNSIKELKTSLELANSIYEKQAKLWDQKIGTEVQYLQAKNNKDALESKLATANTQLAQAIVRAPFNGTVDNVPAREGELAAPGTPLVRITSPEDMYITADISERFIGKLSVGAKVDVYFPVQDATIDSQITSVSEVINPENRTFQIEVKLPKSNLILKPNQVAVLTLRDYFNKASFVVPTRLIQQDNKGQYIYKVEKKENTIATKLYVKAGLSYDGNTEVTEGITEGDTLVDKGFRDLTDGVEIAISNVDEATSEVAKK